MNEIRSAASRSRWWCFFGLHDWRTLHVQSWGRSTWHLWDVGQECRDCGKFRSWKESNKREVERQKARMGAES